MCSCILIVVLEGIYFYVMNDAGIVVEHINCGFEFNFARSIEMLSNLLFPRISINPAAARDPSKFLPTDTKGWCDHDEVASSQWASD